MNYGSHRFFADSTFRGQAGLAEIAPPPWTDALPAEFRYTYDVLEHTLPHLQAEGLRFYFTKDAYRLPDYGRDVVAVLLQEERCKVPVYGRHVRAVLRNLLSHPFPGWRPHLPLSKLEAVLTFEFARDTYTSVRSRLERMKPHSEYGATIRRDPVTIHLPLGYHSQIELPQVPMADRELDTFFAGDLTPRYSPGSYQRYTSSSKIEARKQLWAVLQQLQQEGQWRLELGNIAAGERSTGAPEFGSYSEKMMHSRLCVAPRGSVADTYRAFEGLRAGCLVLANPLPKDEFFYPGAPVFIVDHWRELPSLLKRFARNIELLEEFRARGLAWWDAHLRPEVLAESIAQQLNAAGTQLLG